MTHSNGYTLQVTPYGNGHEAPAMVAFTVHMSDGTEIDRACFTMADAAPVRQSILMHFDEHWTFADDLHGFVASFIDSMKGAA